MKHTPSPYQAAIYDRIANDTCHIGINAVAGSGKSTTIVGALEVVPSTATSIFLAFNKEIVRELKGKVPEHVHVKTLHSYGLSSLRFKFGFDIPQEEFIDDSKVSKIIVRMMPAWTDVEEDERHAYAARVERIVDLVRLTLPQSRVETLELIEKFDIQVTNGEIDRAKEVLRVANSDKRSFDFADMIYRPAIGNWQLKQYDYVFIDEAQDLNRAQQAMVRKIVRPNGGRMIAVGDPRQAIYGFAGADADSFQNLLNMFPNTVEMPLSVCYRSASSIVDHAKELVPYIESREGAPSGEVRLGSVEELRDGDFVLCRNTRPLVSLCMRLISKGRKATIKGSDIGKGLISMVHNTRVKGVQPMFNALAKELAKATARAKEKYPLRDPSEVASVANMSDKIEALRVLAQGCPDTDALVARIRTIFVEDVSGIVLSTIHKAKGLEADRVFVVDRHLLPAVYAQSAWERQQERNLDYVARTRAKSTLVYVNDWTGDPRGSRHKDLHTALQSIIHN